MPDSRSRLAMLHAPDGPVANAYRLAARSVLAEPHVRDHADGRPPRRTLVVGIDASVDGAVAATNIAIAAAAAGTRTVLIDANIRSPRIHALLDMPNDAGLSTLPADETSATAQAVATDITGLAIIPVGPSPSAGVDLLARPAVNAAVRAATEDAGLVIVSCAPLASGPDAVLVSRWVDSAIVIVGARSTRRAAGAQAVTQLERAGVRVLGAMFSHE